MNGKRKLLNCHLVITRHADQNSSGKMTFIQPLSNLIAMRKQLLFFGMFLGAALLWQPARAQSFMNFSIQQPAPLDATFSSAGGNLTFTFSQVNPGASSSWSWNFGTGDTSTLASPTYTFPEGTFNVCLTVQDQYGCSATYCDNLVVVGNEEPDMIHGLSIQPNPFSSSTRLSYTLDRMAQVQVRVFTLQGALVESVVNESQTAGAHSYVLGTGLAQGTYLVSIELDGKPVARRMMKLQ